MPELPPQFQFTQSNLQDYVDCARRFDLKYLQALKFPAIEEAPIAEREQRMRQGAEFHHLVYQHHVGVPETLLTQTILDDPLRSWWENYIQHRQQDLPAQQYAEIALSAPLAGHRLLAKYDLIAIESQQRIVIIDWKTSHYKPRPENLHKRLQSIVYPYLLVVAGAHLNSGQSIQPEQIEMRYWFAEHPQEPIHFPYSTEQFHEDEAYLHQLIEEIITRQNFHMTTDTKLCKFCVYRSLCNRGISAGNIHDIQADINEIDDDLDLDFDFDFDQIAEVEF